MRGEDHTTTGYPARAEAERRTARGAIWGGQDQGGKGSYGDRTKARQERRKARCGVRTEHGCGRVGIGGRGQVIGCGRGRTGAGPGGGREPVRNMEGAGPGEERSRTWSRREAGQSYSRDRPRRAEPAGRRRGSGGAEGRVGADQGAGAGVWGSAGGRELLERDRGRGGAWSWAGRISHPGTPPPAGPPDSPDRTRNGSCLACFHSARGHRAGARGDTRPHLRARRGPVRR